MPRRNRRRARGRRGRAPLLVTPSQDQIPSNQSCIVTLTALTSISASTLSTTITWDSFGDFEQLASVFQYFQPMTYKIDLSVLTNESLPFTCIALQPINWTSDGTSFTVSADATTLLCMPGRILAQHGSTMKGNTVKWPPNAQQLSTALGASEPACVLLRDFSPATGITGIAVYIRCRFYRRSVISPTESSKLITVFRSPLTSLEKIQKHLDIESNPCLTPRVISMPQPGDK